MMKSFLFLFLLLSVSLSNAQSPVIITEIMADPTPLTQLPDAEYVELYNRSATPVNLSGWSLFEGSARLLPSLVLLPNEYLIVCAVSDTMKLIPFGRVAGISSMTLTNAGEKISLRNAAGLPLDSVTYSDAWYNDAVKADGGWSLERIDRNFSCILSSNWGVAMCAAGGTPGYINSIDGITNDIDPPILLYAYSLDENQATLVFSESLESGAINISLNYEIDGGRTVTSAQSFNDLNTQITITFSPSLLPGEIVSVRVHGLMDCAGNYCDSTYSTPTGMAYRPVQKDIVINEVLFNPKEDGVDFLELYNASSHTVDLSKMDVASLSLTTGNILNHEKIISDPMFLYPGEYVYLSDNPAVVASQYSSSYPRGSITSLNLPSMNIDEGHLTISYDTLVIDEIHYYESYHFPLLNDPKGISLEKINPFRNGLDPTSWNSSAPDKGGASPGLRNTQYAGIDQSSSFISVSPEIFSPDLDGYNDVVNFFFETGKAGVICNISIFDSNGNAVFRYRVNRMLASSDAISWNGFQENGFPAAPGIYIALIELFDLTGMVHNEKRAFVLAKRMGD